ncbi:hypothetical protein [Salinispora arenicola]|uniref:hypothetical protein n=1 Tax=Salinispora arenicola TaxID=168697 RepID=UPI000379524D|nr:hypothetical protein [Salinispora arenicola]
MSNYQAQNNAIDPEAASKRRRKLWLASGVAGLTGVVSIAAVGFTGAGAGARDLAWNTAQITKNGEQVADDPGAGRVGGWEANHRGDSDGNRDDRNRGKKRHGKEVPCNTDQLIQAIVYANSNQGGVLKLAKDCTYTLTRSDKHGNGLPIIKEPITLAGYNTKIVRDSQADFFRILNVGRGGHLKVEGLTIKGGKTLEGERGANTPEAVWSRFSNSVAAGEAAKAGKPFLPLLQAEPGAAARGTDAARAAEGAPAGRVAAATDAAPAPVWTDRAPAGRSATEGAPAIDAAPAAGWTDRAPAADKASAAEGAPADRLAPAGRAAPATDAAPAPVWTDRAPAADKAPAGGWGDKAPAAKKEKPKVLRHDRSSDGAGVLVQAGGTAEFEKSYLEHNLAGGVGGGLANFGKTSLYHTTVANNDAFHYGGGIFNAGVLRVSSSRVMDNGAAIGGGGIANGAAFVDRKDIEPGYVTVEKAEVTGNEVLGFGGGLFDIGGETTVKQSIVARNLALLAGGGIAAVEGSNLYLKEMEVADNTTIGDGGGLALALGAIANVDKSKVRDNKAGVFGGGVFNLLSAVTFRNSSVSGNLAGISGGGIFNVAGSVDLTATKVTKNRSTLEPGGVFSALGKVTVDNKSAVKGNDPTNCKGSVDRIENCFG